MEFADHRPLYDWCIERVQPSGLLPNSAEGWRPRQTEFSRLNLQYTVLSKRKLIQLVTGRHVDGWDDPRLPTISGLRRRGYPSAAIRLFCERIGISRAEGTIEIDVFEETMREHLDAEAPRIFAVAEPLKLTITNWIPDAEDTFTVENHPKRTEYGAREIKFTNELLIDKSDFFDTGVKGDLPPPKGFKRLLLNNCVRLKNAFVVTCYDVVRDPVTGDVIEVLCTYDRDTSNGRNSPNSKKPKGIVQWVSQKYGVPVQLNIYDRLFSTPIPGRDHPDGDFLHDINADSKSIVTNAYIEPSIANWATGSVFQFERLGYFYLDPVSNPSLPQQEGNSVMSKDKNPSYIFNRVVTLKDTWQQALVDREGPATASTPESAALTAEYYRLDIRVGQVMSVEQHPAAENLYIQQIDCGDEKGPRVVVSGLVKYLESDQLLGKKVVVLCNLKPSKFRGVMSEGMVLTAVQESSTTGPDGTATSTITALELISPPANAKAGENLYLSLSDVNQPSTTTLSKDAWLKIAPKLRVNEKKELCFDGPQNSLKTKKGPCVTTSLTETQVQ